MNENKKIKIPNHVAIIPDGNEEWAKERNLKKIDGSKKGYEMIIKAPFWFFQAGVSTLSIFFFSNKEWERDREEVNSSMKMIKTFLVENLDEIDEKNYKILISGKTDELPGDLPEICLEVKTKTKDNTGIILNLCLNYGGREEIIDAFKKMMKNKVELKQIHSGMIKKYLYNPDLKDPDLIVRTSGKKTLSGLLLWQSIESEILFTDKYWPDFEENDVKKIIEEYNFRKNI